VESVKITSKGQPEVPVVLKTNDEMAFPKFTKFIIDTDAGSDDS
jgi:hypothetical protein